MKSKIEMEFKTTSTLKKKDRLVKNLKEKFGKGANEEEEEEDEEDEEEQTQEPLALTQSMGEDKEEEKIEVSKGEEAKEAPTQAEPKKRNTKAQLVSKAKKIVKPSPTKPTIPTTREST